MCEEIKDLVGEGMDKKKKKIDPKKFRPYPNLQCIDHMSVTLHINVHYIKAFKWAVNAPQQTKNVPTLFFLTQHTTDTR